VHAAAGRLVAETAACPTTRLCCGSAGVVAALPPGSDGHTSAVKRLVGRDGRLRNEIDTTFPGTSLFRGVAGVGQTLLRTLHPSLPDPLTLDLGHFRSDPRPRDDQHKETPP
jgi:hypothetical protein